MTVEQQTIARIKEVIKYSSREELLPRLERIIEEHALAMDAEIELMWAHMMDAAFEVNHAG